MSDTATTETLREKALNLAKHGEAADLMEVWNDIIAEPPADQDFYNQLVRARATTYDPTAVLDLLVQLVRSLQERQMWQHVIRVVDAAASIWPDNDTFREAVLLALTDKYADLPNIDGILKATRLEDGAPVDQALKRFRGLLKLSPGRVYQHATWGVGVVQKLDLEQGKVTLDFPEEQGRVLTLAGVRDFLSYLAPSHFLARRATDPTKLYALADEDPAAMVRLILESFKGKIKQGEMKSMLLNGVIPDSKWTGWWTKARAAMKMDPMIDFDKGGAHAEIALRSKPKTFEEEVQDLFFSPDSELAERIAAVQKLEATAAANKPSTDLLSRMLRALDADYRAKQNSLPLSDRVQLAFLARDLKNLGEGLSTDNPSIPAPADVLNEVEDSYDTLAKMDSENHSAEALTLLMERDGDKGFERAAALFPKASNKLAQVIWKALDPEHHKDIAIHAAQAVIEKPLNNPPTYMWVIKQIGEGHWAHLKDYFPLSQVVPDILDNIDAWDKMLDHPSVDRATQASAKLLISRMKSQLENKGFAMMCGAVEEMDLDSARRFRRSIQAHHALQENYRSAAERAVVLTRRELEDEQAAPPAGGGTAAASGPEEGGLHYTTEKARDEKFRELEDLMQNKIPENSREIEKARSEGDLKENAGYIYAKEQQKLLMQQSLQLQQALQNARVFDKSKVTTASVNFGVAFDATNLKKNTKETYTVLGQFETDPDRNIISYNSPFMKQFVGKKAGEEVIILHPDGSKTPYRIEKIVDALASGEWDLAETE